MSSSKPSTRSLQSPVRERVLEISRQVEKLRDELANLEKELAHALNAPGEAAQRLTQGKAAPFTRKVFRVLQRHPDASATYLVEHLEGGDDDRVVKRVHNSLRTLHRQGLAERVGRGRWRATLPIDTTCTACCEPYSSLMGRCPRCNQAPGERHNGEGAP